MESITLPRLYLTALERARRPGASPNELVLAHMVDALLVLLILCPEAGPLQSSPKGDKISYRQND